MQDLLKKHVTKLENALDKMLQAWVSAEIAKVSPDEPWMVESKQDDVTGKAIFLQAEGYLLEIER